MHLIIAFLFASAEASPFLFIFKVVLACIASFGSPYFGLGTTRPYLYYGGGLALLILLLLLILGV